MLKKLLGAALTLALVVPHTGWAQSDPAPAPAPAPVVTQDADPALWVVRDEDTTIYLFGTVHALKPGLGWFDEGIKAAFDRSDEVRLEIVLPEDPAAVQALMLKAALNPEGPSLTEKVPTAKRQAYLEALGKLGIPAAALDRFDPWLVAAQISMLTLVKNGWDPESGSEKVLTAAAKAAGKPVRGLETIEQQVGYFESLSDKAEMSFLTATIDEIDGFTKVMDGIVDHWAKGDADAIAVALNESMRESPEVARILLAQRNQRWASWIKWRLAQPGTVFVAVGSGHLAGADSVQDYLKVIGLEATRVDY